VPNLVDCHDKRVHLTPISLRAADVWRSSLSAALSFLAGLLCRYVAGFAPSRLAAPDSGLDFGCAIPQDRTCLLDLSVAAVNPMCDSLDRRRASGIACTWKH
jgi:hypothetical protein